MIIIQTMNGPVPRLIEEALRRAAAVMPVVIVTGARQTGKSTLVRDLVAGDASAGSIMMDQAESRGLDPQQRERLERVAAALESGSGFLTMQEEVLPVGETCCFIGRYDAQSRAIDALGKIPASGWWGCRVGLRRTPADLGVRHSQ